jgi:hypothetical protein
MTIRRAPRQISTQVERVGKEQGEALPVQPVTKPNVRDTKRRTQGQDC